MLTPRSDAVLDAVAEPLRADVADQVRGAVLWPLSGSRSRPTPLAGHRRLAIVGRVELLLRERRQQQAQPFQLPRLEDAVEQLVEVVERDQLALRDIAQVGALVR